MKKLCYIFLAIALAGTAQAQTTKKKKAAAAPAKPVIKADKPVEKKPAEAAPQKTAEVKKPAAVKPVVKDEAFEVKGSNLLNAGVGLGTYYQGLPLGVSFEHGFSDQISGGVFADYSSSSDGGFYSDGSKLTIIYAGVRASYHLGQLFKVTNKNFDPYAGASLGYHHVSFSFDDGTGFSSPYSNSLFFGVHGGARYLFSDHVGGFAEVGYGVAALKLGLTFKF